MALPASGGKPWWMADRRPCVAWPIAWACLYPEQEDRCLRECILPWRIRILPSAADLRDMSEDGDERPRKQARRCGSVTAGRGFGGSWPRPSFSKWRINRRSTCNVRMTPPAACGISCVYMCCNSIQAAIQHRASGTIPDQLHPRRSKRLLSRNVHASASARCTWHCAHLQAMPEWQQPGWHAPRA